MYPARRQFLPAALLAMSMLAWCAGCAATSSGRVTHVVLCWLKEPGNEENRRRLIETSRALSKIPGVIEVRAGTAVPSDRPIVDATFDVGITMTFASIEAMNAYLSHPDHVKATTEILRPLAGRVVVYDLVEP